MRFAADGITLDRVEESTRKSWSKAEWRVVQELARHDGPVPRDLTVRVQVAPDGITVSGSGIELSAKTPTTSGYRAAWFQGAGFAELGIE